MATTTTNLVITQTDPLELGGRTGKSALRLIANRLYSYLSGAKRGASIQIIPDTTSAPVRAHGTIAFATSTAGTVVEVNGAPFTGITGNVVAANDEYDIDGDNAAEATDFARAVNASTHANISGIVTAAAVGADILTPSTAIAGNSFKVVLADGTSHTFIGQASAVTVGTLRFDTRTSNAACADSIVAQVNGYAPFSGKLSATDGTTIVTFTSLDGNTFTLTGTVTTLAQSNGGRVLIRAVQPGAIGNAIPIKSLGVVPTGTITAAAVAADDTVTINGAALTAKQQRATGTLTPATSIAGDTFAIGGNTFTGAEGAVVLGEKTFSVDTSDVACGASIAAQINGFAPLSGIVTATADGSTGVVTIRAVTAGTAGNAITLTGTAVTLAASGSGTLAGGIAVANDQFEAIGTNTQVAADLVRCINASTTAAISSYVRATSAAAVVTLRGKGKDIGPLKLSLVSSDGATLAVTGSGFLTAGTLATSEGAAAVGTITITTMGTSNTITPTINGLSPSATTYDTSKAVTAATCALTINAIAGLAGVVRAVASGDTIVVTSCRGGLLGNAIPFTVASADGGGSATSIAANGSGYLGGTTAGAEPTTVVCSGEKLVRGAGGTGTSLTITL